MMEPRLEPNAHLPRIPSCLSSDFFSFLGTLNIPHIISTFHCEAKLENNETPFLFSMSQEVSSHLQMLRFPIFRGLCIPLWPMHHAVKHRKLCGTGKNSKALWSDALIKILALPLASCGTSRQWLQHSFWINIVLPKEVQRVPLAQAGHES